MKNTLQISMVWIRINSLCTPDPGFLLLKSGPDPGKIKNLGKKFNKKFHFSGKIKNLSISFKTSMEDFRAPEDACSPLNNLKNSCKFCLN
jgi:hypothetical protein